MINIPRRSFSAGLAGLCLSGAPAALFAQGAAQAKTGTRLILLGTMGGARIFKGRASPAQVIVVNEKLYVIDCGEGVARQLALADCDLRQLKAVFITHHHDDHDLDYGNLIQVAKMTGLRSKVKTFGPYPIREIARNFQAMNEYSFSTYQAELEMIPFDQLVEANEISRSGPVMEDENVKVTCCLVNHPPIPAFGFRFDTADRAITISGDTNYSPALVELARGCDVLVHEVMYKPAVDRLVARAPQYKGLGEFLHRTHTTSEDVGRVAHEAGVKTLVLSHFVPGDDPSITDEMWVEGAARFFKGTIIVGKDLMVI
jgi:ribonuclease BN (tRNA processing enzyme)